MSASGPAGREEAPPLSALRGGLRAAIRRAAGLPLTTDAPPAGRKVDDPGPLLVREECFGPGHGGYPADLFGPGFTWEDSGPPLVFFDLETCGLADEPIFLAGVLRPEGPALRLWMLLARDPSGEPALLRRSGELLGPGLAWVSFNGRSFDAPRLRRRSAVHRIVLGAPPDHHDLLLAVRRRFGKELPNCRLNTVERRLLKLDRGPRDVPGREAPERYRDYVRTGEMRWIEPVIEHNRRDVAAMAALYRRLLPAGESKLSTGSSPRGR